MEKALRWELQTVMCLAILLLLSIIPSLLFARREARDGAVRDQLAATKQKLEEINNQLKYYPLTFDASPFEYVVTEKNFQEALGWFLRARLEQSLKPISAFDYEGDRNYYFRISQIDGQTLYDVCGGTERCGAPPKKD
ncbi:MAG: hypothetical protein HYZ62_01690 [Candidatus Andersenbacteria bacterium]|nr:hypothetical protein [Candidatus Andersenbacteria bacterium]